MNISLTPELDSLVREKVKSGMYHSASEVIREALRLFQRQEQLNQQQIELLKTDVQKGIHSLGEGLGVPFTEEVADGIKRRGRERLASK